MPFDLFSNLKSGNAIIYTVIEVRVRFANYPLKSFSANRITNNTVVAQDLLIHLRANVFKAGYLSLSQPSRILEERNFLNISIARQAASILSEV